MQFLKQIVARTLVLACMCLATSAQYYAGVKNSLDISVIEQAKDVYFNEIVKLVNNLTIPDIHLEGDKGYMLDNKFVLMSTPDDVQFITDVQDNAVIFEVDDFKGTFYCDHFRYKETIFVAKGSIQVDLKKIKFKAGVGFGKQTLADGRMVPLIEAVDVDLDISRTDIKIHIDGNIWSDFADIFAFFFKGTVIGMIEDTAEAALNTGIPAIGNGLMTKLDGYFTVPFIPNWIVDWETPQSAIVTDNYFAIGVKGLMFDQRIGEQEPGVAAPDMPYYSASNSEKYQAYLSTYSIDGFFSSFIEVAGIHAWVNSTQIPVLTTDTIDILLPGIKKHYGSDVPVDIHYNVTQLGQFSVSEANEELGGVASLALEFWVENADGTKEMAADLSLEDIAFQFTALVDNMDVSVAIDKINIDSVDVLSDTFGRLNALTIKVKLNNGFRLGLPVLNHILANHHIPIPSNILGLFELSNAVLGYHDDYIYVGATPTFIGPSSVPTLDEVSSVMQALSFTQ